MLNNLEERHRDASCQKRPQAGASRQGLQPLCPEVSVEAQERPQLSWLRCTVLGWPKQLFLAFSPALAIVRGKPTRA